MCVFLEFTDRAVNFGRKVNIRTLDGNFDNVLP
jgi:hypothetical protein